jgi:hypothetical protein
MPNSWCSLDASNNIEYCQESLVRQLVICIHLHLAISCGLKEFHELPGCTMEVPSWPKHGRACISRCPLIIPCRDAGIWQPNSRQEFHMFHSTWCVNGWNIWLWNIYWKQTSISEWNVESLRKIKFLNPSPFSVLCLLRSCHANLMGVQSAYVCIYHHANHIQPYLTYSCIMLSHATSIHSMGDLQALRREHLGYASAAAGR